MFDSTATPRRAPAMGTRPMRALVAALVALLAFQGASLFGAAHAGATAGTGAAAVQDPLVAPGASLSADGRTASTGRLTLSVSRVLGLAPGGQALRIIGSGFDTNKGIYVALCVIPPPNATPSPCGGGADTNQSSGASKWISSNAPSYGAGLAQPYGPGGTFDVTINVSAAISPSINCAMVRCAITTRNDHTRGADRSQDLQVPVAFAAATVASPAPASPVPAAPSAPGAPQPSAPTPAPGQAAPGASGGTPSTAAPDTSTTTSTTTTSTTPPAPTAKVSGDGLSVSDGARTLSARSTEDLDPSGDTVEVEGSGLDPSRGVFVSLCALADPADPAAPPGPCASGSGRSIWYTNEPPKWAGDRAEPLTDGAFAADLELAAVIDADTDCRDVECAIVVRADDSAGDDRSLDLALPVSFSEGSTDGATEGSDAGGATTAGADSSDDGDGAGAADSGGSAMWPAAAVVVLLAAAGGGFLWWRRRRSDGAAVAPGPDPEVRAPGPAGGSTSA